MILILLIVFAAVLFFILWRLRFGYTPPGFPQALCYHKICRQFCFEGTWTTPERFFGQIDFLLSRGYTFINENEFLTSLDNPSRDNDKKLLLTFDDGYEEIIDLVIPGLQFRNVPALVFLVAGYSGRTNSWDLSLGRRSFKHISWEEAVELKSQGVHFGSHGFTHADLTQLSVEGCKEEMQRSKDMLEDRLGAVVRSFSYPFGRYNRKIKKIAADVGYEAAFSLYPAHTNGIIDRYALRRNGIYIIDSHRTVLRKLEPGPLYWLEETKCRAINGIAVLTPLIKRFCSPRGS